MTAGNNGIVGERKRIYGRARLSNKARLLSGNGIGDLAILKPGKATSRFKYTLVPRQNFPVGDRQDKPYPPLQVFVVGIRSVRVDSRRFDSYFVALYILHAAIINHYEASPRAHHCWPCENGQVSHSSGVDISPRLALSLSPVQHFSSP